MVIASASHIVYLFGEIVSDGIPSCPESTIGLKVFFGREIFPDQFAIQKWFGILFVDYEEFIFENIIFYQ